MMFGHFMFGADPGPGEVATRFSNVGTYSQARMSVPYTNSVRGCLRAFFKVNSVNGQLQHIIGNQGTDVVRVFTDSSRRVIFEGGTNSAKELIIASNTNAFNVGQWNSLVVSWDMSIPKRQMYINRVSNVGSQWQRLSSSSIDWNGAFLIGARYYDINSILEGCVSEVYVNRRTFFDLSSATNLNKFVTTNNRPTYLGDDGKVPDGYIPVTYTQKADGTDDKVSNTWYQEGILLNCDTVPG